MDLSKSRICAIQYEREAVTFVFHQNWLMQAVKLILKDQPVPIMCLIRCRAGGFVYSSEEVALMKVDINALKEAGADGFVIGKLPLHQLLRQ